MALTRWYLHKPDMLHSTYPYHTYPELRLVHVGQGSCSHFRAEAWCHTNTVISFPDWCSVALFRLNTIKWYLPHPDADKRPYVSLGWPGPPGKGVSLCLQLAVRPHKCERRDGLRAHQRSSHLANVQAWAQTQGKKRRQHLRSQSSLSIILPELSELVTWCCSSAEQLSAAVHPGQSFFSRAAVPMVSSMLRVD